MFSQLVCFPKVCTVVLIEIGLLCKAFSMCNITIYFNSFQKTIRLGVVTNKP